MSIFIMILIAISLSMDAFSLSLAYGTLSLSKNYMFKLSLIVGIYHFFMPLLGMNIGSFLFSIIPIKPEIIIFIILSFIGIQMIIESFKKIDSQKFMNFFQILLFGLAVSIDSFSVGIGLHAIGPNPLISSITFSISSLIFTYLGLVLGKKINFMIGKTSTVIGGIILIVIGFFSLFK